MLVTGVWLVPATTACARIVYDPFTNATAPVVALNAAVLKLIVIGADVALAPLAGTFCGDVKLYVATVVSVLVVLLCTIRFSAVTVCVPWSTFSVTSS